MSDARVKTIFVSVGSEFVTLKTQGSRQLRTARVLGDETGPDGTRTLWLDRVVLGRHEFDSLEDGWRGGGAISTVLTREEPAAPPVC